MIFRFLRNLASSSPAGEVEPHGEAREYKGYNIQATPQREGGGWRVRGIISKAVEGETRTHTLIRADTYPDKQTAADMTVMKAKRVIDEQGETLFKAEGGSR